MDAYCRNPLLYSVSYRGSNMHLAVPISDSWTADSISFLSEEAVLRLSSQNVHSLHFPRPLSDAPESSVPFAGRNHPSETDCSQKPVSDIPPVWFFHFRIFRQSQHHLPTKPFRAYFICYVLLAHPWTGRYTPLVSFDHIPNHSVTDSLYIPEFSSHFSLPYLHNILSLIHIWRCRRSTLCRSRWSPYH